MESSAHPPLTVVRKCAEQTAPDEGVVDGIDGNRSPGE